MKTQKLEWLLGEKVLRSVWKLPHLEAKLDLITGFEN